MLLDASITQAKLGANVAGNGPAFGATLTAAAQSIPHATSTKIAFDTEEFDTNSNFASSRFTPTVAGYYQINGSALMSSGTGGVCEAYLYKNGAAFKAGQSTATIAGGQTVVAVESLIYLNGTTDYVELFFNQTTGGAQTVANDARYTYMNGFLARSA